MIMRRYHQPYSEIEKIPTKKLIFLSRLAEAEEEYEKFLMDKKKKEMKMKKGRLK